MDKPNEYKKRVLVLDNDDDILEILEIALTNDGFDVTCINKADNVFQLIDGLKPDIIVIDYLLSGINGCEIGRQIKEKPVIANLPVLLMSAYDRALISRSNCRCDDFIAKPFDLDDLTDRIRKFTGFTALPSI